MGVEISLGGCKKDCIGFLGVASQDYTFILLLNGVVVWIDENFEKVEMCAF